MSLLSLNKTRFTRHKLLTLLLGFVIFIIFILVLARLMLGTIIEISASNWLESQGISPQIGKIEISLIQGKASIHNISGKNADNQGFAVEQVSLSWNWHSLLDNKLEISNVSIDRLSLDTEFHDSGKTVIAGIDFTQNNEDKSTNINASATEQTSSQLPWEFEIQKINLSKINICTKQFSSNNSVYLDYCHNLSDLTWRGSISYKMTAQPSPAVPVYINGDLALHQLVLHNNLLQLDLLRVSEIKINTLNIKTPDDINIESININKLSAFERTPEYNKDIKHIMSFTHLNMSPVSLSGMHKLSIGNIEITDLQSAVDINTVGKNEIDSWTPVTPADSAPVKPAQATQAETKAFIYTITKLQLNSKKTTRVKIRGVEEPVEFNIKDIILNIENINSDKPESQSSALIEMTLGSHARITVNTSGTPLASPPTIEGNASITGLDLRPIAPLLRENIGYDIKSGQLDANSNIKITKGIIDSEITLNLHHFNLKTLNKEQAEKLNSELGFPLSSSLSMLRDRDDKIQLTIPVTGNIDNPEFSPSDAIRKASSKAITAAILHIYTPFGLVFAAESLFDLATGLYIDPVIFEAGQKNLSDSNKELLDRLSILMKERPGIHITLCSFSNEQDRLQMFNNNDETLITQKDNADIPREQLTQLITLGESRSQVVKNYLVKEKAIEHSRLVECAAEYIRDDISGVKISL